MRVFVTGATGFIGSAVVKELLSAGHEVVGLARSAAAAAALRSIGVDAHHGSVEDLDSLRSGVAQADGVVHLGFIHDFSKYVENCEIDRRAITAMGEVLKGPMVVASGTVLGKEGEATASSELMPRAATEEAMAAVVARGGNVVAVRLTPTVHDEGDKGFVPMIIQLAKEKGVAGYIGDGANRWPAVHRQDAARLFRMALEQAEPGIAYHAVGEEGVSTKQIAEVIGKYLGVPVVSIPVEQAGEHFGWFGGFWGGDFVSESVITQERLGWRPEGLGLIADMEKNYFK
jgi:nucleoside-diphosphate-sugar epimerase